MCLPIGCPSVRLTDVGSTVCIVLVCLVSSTPDIHSVSSQLFTLYCRLTVHSDTWQLRQFFNAKNNVSFSVDW